MSTTNKEANPSNSTIDECWIKHFSIRIDKYSPELKDGSRNKLFEIASADFSDSENKLDQILINSILEYLGDETSNHLQKILEIFSKNVGDLN